MSVGNFDLISEALFAHQQRMEQLMQENYELRCQLSDLREARGTFIEICGRRFALQVDQVSTSTINTTTLATTPLIVVAEPMIPTQPTIPPEQQPISATEETALMTDIDEAPTASLAQPVLSTMDIVDDQEAKPATMTFLEEMMFDEFALATTTPMTVWSDPVQKPEAIDEREKAALRRELVGSFLLE